MNQSLLSPASEWIWLPGLPEENCYVQFRQRFRAEDMTAAELRISAEGQYAAFLNGSFIPSSQYADFPHFKAVQTPLLTGLLRRGENELEIQVWYPGADTSVSRKETPGLRFEVWQGQSMLCGSGSRTLARPMAEYEQGAVPNITAQLGAGFYRRPGPEEPWRRARPVDKPAQLVKRPIPELVVKDCIPAKIMSQGVFRWSGGTDSGSCQQRAGLYFRPLAQLSGGHTAQGGIALRAEEGDGMYLLLDLGSEQVGYLTLDITAPIPVPVEIGFGEHLEDLRVRTSVGGRCFAVRGAVGPERKRFVHRFRRLGCRYLQLFLPCREAVIYEAGITPTVYPVNQTPAFACADHLHQAIYDVSKHTLLSCMHEHYEDCPWREQALYGFDSRNQMLAGYYAFGAFDLPRESIRLLALSQRSDGLLELCAPARVPVNIPSFSLIFPVCLEEYCRYSGDLEFGREMYPVAERIMESVLRHVREGVCWNYQSVGYWNFYEWNPLLDGMPLERTQALEPSAEAGLQLFTILALQRMGRLREYFGWEGDALEQARQGLERGLEQFWSEEDGAYASFLRRGEKLQYAELIQALALYTGACPAHRRSSLREGLAEGRWLPATLSYSVFKYEALLQEPERYAQQVFHEIACRWGRMLLQGATAFWETDRGAADFDGAGSLCHGWSGIPIYLYGAYVLGVQPERPGQWRKQAALCTGIHEAHGVLCTPEGEMRL